MTMPLVREEGECEEPHTSGVSIGTVVLVKQGNGAPGEEEERVRGAAREALYHPS